VCDIVVKKFTFVISSPDEFLCLLVYCSLHCRYVFQSFYVSINQSINMYFFSWRHKRSRELTPKMIHRRSGGGSESMEQSSCYTATAWRWTRAV